MKTLNPNKKTISLFFILLFILQFSSIAQIKKVSLVASGLTCSMCSNAIFQSLKKVPFVSQLESNVEKSTFTFEAKDQSSIDLRAVVKAVEKAGFSIAKLTFDLQTNAQKIDNNKQLNVANNNYYFVEKPNNIDAENINLQWLDKKTLTKKAYEKIKDKLVVSKNTNVYNVNFVR